MSAVIQNINIVKLNFKFKFFCLDGSMEKNKQLDVLYLVEWLLKKLNSNNLYVKLSAVRSLANFSRYSKLILIFS